MSASNKNLAVALHSRVTKTKSDNATADGASSSRSEISEEHDGGSAGIVRSTSGAMAEDIRDIRLVGNGYRRGIDLFTGIEPSVTDAAMVSATGGKAEVQERGAPATASGEGGKAQAPVMKLRSCDSNPQSPGQSVFSVTKDIGAIADGIQKSYIDRRSPNKESSEIRGESSGCGSANAVRNSNTDQGGHNCRRTSLSGEDEASAGMPTSSRYRQSNSAHSSNAPAAHPLFADGNRQRALLAPYHVSQALCNTAAATTPIALPQQQPSGFSMVRYQQQTPRRQPPPHSLSRPATFSRLTRNGPFCPCFSPNDSDTEPSSPVADTAASASSGRNVASFARELRARFVTSNGPRSGASNGHQAVERFGMGIRGRGTTGEAINVVAEPYPVQVHTQVEYSHYLVPDLQEITRAPYYWGVMDRFEAERLLDNQPEGTFLLRDSAQSEYLFSVSFRRYNRTLHARIEQLNHKFSFDSYDQGVFSADTVTALIEHYKDPSTFLFFEPQLSIPLPRKFVFPLQHLCRAVIANHVNYNDINQLELPKKFKDYLREYHYKHPVRVTKLE